MSITLIGYIAIPILIILSVKMNIKKFMMLTFILSTMTSTTIFKINALDFSLPIGYFSAICMIAKVGLYRVVGIYREKSDFSKLIFSFVVLAGISLIIPIIKSSGSIVLTPNDIYAPIEFNMQMITQYIYLVFVFIVFITSIYIMKVEEFCEEDFYVMVKYSLILTIILSILQYVMPIEGFNSIFRTGHFNNQTINGRVRLTGATIEASILSFMVVPLIIYIINRLFKIFKISDIIICILTLIILIQAKSSTFFIGIIIGISIIVILNISRIIMRGKVEKNKLVIVTFCAIVILCMALYFSNELEVLLIRTIEKLNGDGVSGFQRSTAFEHHINVFKENIIIGVGYGTIRSYDLFSTWLAELGIIGTLPFFIFNIIIIVKLLKINTFFSNSIMTIIILNTIMMMVSIPEPYFIFSWIYYACGYYIKRRNIKYIE